MVFMKCCALVMALLLGVPAAIAQGGNSFAIRGVRVFDGRSVLAHANVVVRDGRILAVGRFASIPEGVRVIDGRGRTLLPGLIDSHVHVFPGAQADALRFGVTTELDMFDASPDFGRWRAQRESYLQVSESDTWSAGTGVTVPGGHPIEWVPADMPRLGPGDDADSFVAARLAAGSDYIKLFLEDNAALDPAKPLSTLSPAETCAVVAAAHAHARLAIAHVTQRKFASEAIECGADGLAHVFVDTVADDQLIAAARARRLFVITTLSVISATSGRPDAARLVDRPDIAQRLSAAQSRSLRAAFPTIHPEHIIHALASVQRLHAAGIRILAGTDVPGFGTAHGVSLHQELALLVEAGLTPAQALAAATAESAEVFELADRGRILPGRRADLIMVDGDPTRDIADTMRIAAIWKNGFPVERATQNR
jgi:imidazolonepropionase-like amidohydrolase